ncbi:MAG: hypothetical protein ACLTYN_00595 [Dysosmobacter welbionis]
MDGHTLTDALTPRQFSEMTDLDYELVCLLYTAYAAEEEAYGRIVGGLDDYAVPLMDMFFFAYDKAEEGYVDLDEEQQADLDDLYEQLDNARVQMLGENYTRMLINLNLPEEGGDLCFPPDHPPGGGAVLRRGQRLSGGGFHQRL